MARRIFSTWTGGYRIVYDESSEEYVNWSLHLGQILVYAIVPVLVVIGSAIELPIVAGALGAVINLIIMIISYKKERNNTDNLDPEASLFTKSGYLFLFPAKQNMWEGTFCLILSFLLPLVHATDYDLGTLLIVTLSSYSLFSK